MCVHVPLSLSLSMQLPLRLAVCACLCLAFFVSVFTSLSRSLSLCVFRFASRKMRSCECIQGRADIESQNDITLLRDAIMRVHICIAKFTMMYVVDVCGIRLVSSVYQS